MLDYQFNKIQESGDQPLDDDTRILQAEDIDRYHLLIEDITLKQGSLNSAVKDNLHVLYIPSHQLSLDCRPHAY